MKKLILSALLFFALPVVADGNNNNTIVVKPNITVNGCGSSCGASSCSAKKAKTIVKKVVVEKVVEKRVEVPVDHIVHETQYVPVVVVKKVQRKNRINLLAGVGPAYLHGENGTNQVDLKSGAVGGVQYQRLITERVNLGIQVQTSLIQTNTTVLGSVGYDF